MSKLPPWLQNVPLPPVPRSRMGGAAAAAGAAAAGAADALPDWLQGAATDIPPPTEPEREALVPDWLQGTAPLLSSAESEEVPEWLRDAHTQPPTTEDSADKDVPEWLRETEPAAVPRHDGDNWLLGGSAPPAIAEDDDVPDWLKGSGASSMPESDSSLPPWLPKDDATDSPAFGTDEEETDSGELPEWLRGEPTSAPVVRDDTVPDWLQEKTPTPPPSANEQEDIPDWLRGSDESLPIASDPVEEDTTSGWLKSLDKPAVESVAPLEPDVPDWLQGAASPPPSDEPDSQEIPDWLQGGLTDDSEPTAPPRRETLQMDSSSGATDWLRSLGVDEQDGDISDLPSDQSRGDDTSDDDADIDDDSISWLKDVSPDEIKRDIQQPEPPSDPDDLPDIDPFHFDIPTDDDAPAKDLFPGWLANESPSSDDDMFGWLGGSEAPATSAPAPPPKPGVPDWLGGGDETPADTTETDVPDWLSSVTPAAPSPADTTETDVPDWLSSVIPAAPSPADTTETDVPDWLGSSDDAANFVSPSAETEPDVPDWITRDDTSADESAVGDIPDWLREEVDTAPEPPSRADMPDWLQTGTSMLTLPEDQSKPAHPPVADVPAWLADAPAEDLPPPPTSDDSGDVPDWLRSGTSELVLPPDDQPPSPMPSDTGDQSIPLWLRAGADEISTPIQSGDDIPAWLRSGTSELPMLPPDISTPSTRESPTIKPADEGLPSWLQVGDESTPIPAPASDDIPAWLRSGTDELALPSSRSAHGEDIPSWLQPDEPPSAPSKAPPSESGIPEWMIASPAEEELPLPPKEEPPLAPEEDAGIPAWLQSSSEPQPSDVVSPVVDRDTGSDIPPWLASSPSPEPELPPPSDLPPWLNEEAGAAAAAVGGAALPAWLQGAGRDLDEVASLSPAAPTTEEPPAAPFSIFGDEESTPLSRSATEEPPAAPFSIFDDEESTPPSSSAAVGGMEDMLGSTDLPAWLRPIEQTPGASETAPDEEAESIGWLKQLGADDEADESDPVITAVPQTMSLPRPSYTPSPTHMAALAVLQRLVASPYPPVAVPQAPAQSMLSQQTIERIISAMLAIIILVGVLVPALPGMLQLQSPPAAGANIVTLAEQIDALSENDIALVAYEWDAQRRSELELLERAITEHLIDRRVKLILVSTDPQGAILSFDLREPLGAAGYNRDVQGNPVGGQDYVLLGYRPGGELALRSMAQDFRSTLRSDYQGNDATLGALATDITTGEPRIQSIDDLSLVVVMADHSMDVQGWMEQVHRTAPQVPMVHIVPAEVEPQVQPYLRLRNVFWLAGKHDALAYMGRDGSDSALQEMASRSTGLLHLSVLAFIFLFIVGALLGTMVRDRKADS